MFVIKYDKRSMVKLVQSIEKYPAIYNTKKHFSKDEQDHAWDNVAIEVGEKDSLCRDKWHSIKSCYIRHLKYSALNSRRRPYYLAEYLSFLNPFVSERISKFLTIKQSELQSLPSYLKDALPPVQPISYLGEETIRIEPEWVKSELEEVNVVDVVSESECCDISVDVVTSEEPSSSKTVVSDRPNQHAAASTSKKQKTLQISPGNSEDVSFFKSLLPDMARMSSHQKLKFKQEALSLIEDILYATDEINVIS